MKKKIMTNTIDTIGSNEIVEILKPSKGNHTMYYHLTQIAEHMPRHRIVGRTMAGVVFDHLRVSFKRIDQVSSDFLAYGPSSDKIMRDDNYFGVTSTISTTRIYGFIRFDHIYLLKLILDEEEARYYYTLDENCESEPLRNLLKWLRFFYGHDYETMKAILFGMVNVYNTQLLTPHRGRHAKKN